MTRGVGLFLSLAIAAAQPPADKQPASLAGTVVNALTGEPVARAHVSVICPSGSPQGPMTPHTSVTDAKGEFTVGHLSAGSCSVRAERVGFVPSGPSQNYLLSEGVPRDGVNLKLIPAGAIAGHVLDSAGEPVEGAEVSLSMGGRNTINATTDDQGSYRLGGLRPGRYRLKATPQTLPFPPEIRGDGTVEMHHAATYYPGELDLQTAQRVEVKAGEDTSSIDIRLVRTPIVKVSGTVTGMPAGAKNVTVGEISRRGDVDLVKPDGAFTLWRLDPGKHTLVAQSFSGQTQLRSAPLDIEVGSANIEHLELHMVPPFEVPGQVRYEDEQSRQPDQPPVRADGTAPPKLPPRPRQLTFRSQSGDVLSATMAADDSFSLTRFQPGLYRVALNWGTAYVKSVRVGNVAAEGNLLDVRNGATGSVTVSVSSDFCTVSGTVSDAKGAVANGMVLLVSEDDSIPARVARTDASGAFQFKVPPGKYRLAAVDEDEMATGLPTTLENYDDVAVSLDLRAGDKISKDLKRR